MRAVVDLTISDATSRPERSADAPDRPGKFREMDFPWRVVGAIISFAPWSSG